MDLYLPLIGVVIGALLTGGVSWLNDRKQHERTQAAERTKANLELCADFLEAIDQEERGVSDWYSREGQLPGDMGYDEQLSSTRTHLTSLELRCPDPVYQSAVNLVTALEAWAFGATADWAAFRDARAAFIRAVQNDL